MKDADGKPGYRLTDEGIRLGLTHLEWQAAVYNDQGLHGLLRRWVYRNGDLWSYAARPFYGSLALFALGLFVAVPKDQARRAILKHANKLHSPATKTLLYSTTGWHFTNSPTMLGDCADYSLIAKAGEPGFAFPP